MANVISIRPSKDLRTNYAQISLLAHKNPVAITVNGKEDTVVLSHEDYMEQQKYIAGLEAKIEIYTHLAQAEDDIKLGRVQPLEDCFNDIMLDLDGLEL